MQRRTLVENKWVTFIEDTFELPNGSDCTYYHAQKMDSVLAIAVEHTQTGSYTFVVNQHRHPIGQSIWQFPIGGLDLATQDPIESARKELLEETGVLAGSFEYLGSIFADPGFTNQKLHVCATSDIIKIGEQQLEASEHGLISKRVPIDSIGDMINSGEMGDAWGLAGYFYLNQFLSNRSIG